MFHFRHRRPRPHWYVAATALFFAGCAHTPEPYRVRYADIGQGGLGGFNGEAPLVVEFQEGDRVPVVFDFSGEDFRLEPQRPPLELIAKRHIFVRFAMDGVRTSLDGVEFDRKPRVPGSFRFGLRAVKGEPTRFEIAIVAPKR